MTCRMRRSSLAGQNPYWQFFCGFDFFQHEAPINASTMTRWRKRIGPTGLEEMLKASVGVALDTGVAKPSSLERVSVDTTVQLKAIAHPTDSRLYWKALQAFSGRSVYTSTCM
jgi:transposase, IS5 family